MLARGKRENAGGRPTLGRDRTIVVRNAGCQHPCGENHGSITALNDPVLQLVTQAPGPGRWCCQVYRPCLRKFGPAAFGGSCCRQSSIQSWQAFGIRQSLLKSQDRRVQEMYLGCRLGPAAASSRSREVNLAEPPFVLVTARLAKVRCKCGTACQQRDNPIEHAICKRQCAPGMFCLLFCGALAMRMEAYSDFVGSAGSGR